MQDPSDAEPTSIQSPALKMEALPDELASRAVGFGAFAFARSGPPRGDLHRQPRRSQWRQNLSIRQNHCQRNRTLTTECFPIFETSSCLGGTEVHRRRWTREKQPLLPYPSQPAT